MRMRKTNNCVQHIGNGEVAQLVNDVGFYNLKMTIDGGAELNLTRCTLLLSRHVILYMCQQSQEEALFVECQMAIIFYNAYA